MLSKASTSPGLVCSYEAPFELGMKEFDLGMQQGLPVQCGNRPQPLKVVLLIRGMLVHNEEVLA